MLLPHTYQSCVSEKVFYAEHFLHSSHQMFESSHVSSRQMHIFHLLHCDVQDVLRSCPHCLESLHLHVGYSPHVAYQVDAQARIDSTAFTTDLASHTFI